MSSTPWWSMLTPGEIAALRHRVVQTVAARFAAALGAEVEDAVQHAFLALFRNRESISAEDDGLYRYLSIAARNAALDRIKTQSLRSQRVAQTADRADQAPSPLWELLLAEKKSEIRDFLGELEQLDRLVVWRHVVEGKSLHAVARELGIGWHRAAATVERVLDALRRLLVTTEPRP